MPEENNQGTRILNVSNDVREAILRKTAFYLPDNPVESGYSTKQIKEAFYRAITDDDNSILSELIRIVNDINVEFYKLKQEYVNQTNKKSKLYGTNSNGEECCYDVSIDADANAVVKRDGNGNIILPQSQTYPDDVAIPRRYSDNKYVQRTTPSWDSVRTVDTYGQERLYLFSDDVIPNAFVKRDYGGNIIVYTPLKNDPRFDESAAINTAFADKRYLGKINVEYNSREHILKFTQLDAKGYSMGTVFNIDLPLESLITGIDDAIVNGQRVLKLTLQNGTVKTIQLNEIFNGFVKTSDNKSIIYGNDSEGKQIDYTIDTTTNPDELAEGALPLRTTGGNIIVPSMSESTDNEGKYAINREDAENKFANKEQVQNSLSDISDTLKEHEIDIQKVASIDKRVTNLEDVSLLYTEDSDVAYSKMVPDGVAKYALVNKVGGMTYKTKNLCDISYTNSYFVNGNAVTIISNTDDSIEVKGTVGAEPYTPYASNGWLCVRETSVNLAPFKQGDVISISYDFEILELPSDYTKNTINVRCGFGFKGSSSSGIYNTIPVKVNREVQRVQSTITITDATANLLPILTIGLSSLHARISKIMINKGSTALPYEPYFEGLRSVKVSEMQSEGVNIFNFDNINPKYKSDTDTIVINTESYFTDMFSGTNGKQAKVPDEYIPNTIYLTAGTYYIYYNMETEEGAIKNLSIMRVFGDGTIADSTSVENGSSFVAAQNGRYTIRRNSNKPCTISNLMITRVKDAEYKAYKVNTIPISEALRAFLEPHGYGLGVNDEYYNYIDFERKVFVQNVYRKVFYGTENCGSGTVGDSVSKKRTYTLEKIGVPTKDIDIAPTLSSHYSGTSQDKIWRGGEGVALSLNGDKIIIFDANHSTDNDTSWKSHLAELYAIGNPLIVDYALATPNEIDISEYLSNDNFIAVEDGGSITAVNEYEYDVPSTLSFVTKKGL